MQGALEDPADPAYPRFIKSSRHRSERGIHQPLGRTANLGRVGIEHHAPVVPAPGPSPDVPHLVVEPLQLSAPRVGRTIDAFTFLRF